MVGLLYVSLPLLYRFSFPLLDTPHPRMLSSLVTPLLARRRLAIVILLTLLPWPAVWLGMYHFDSLLWTFALYHGVCLLPAVIWGYPLWRSDLRSPTPRQWAWLLGGFVVIAPLSLLVYQDLGKSLMDAPGVLSAVTRRGFRAAWLLPLILYFVPVNAVLEELFWRGTVLNELRGTGEAIGTVGALWTALTFAGWHYLVVRLLVRPGWAELTVVGILGAGVFFDWLYRRTRSIIVPILWHGLVFDLSLLVVFGAVLKAH